MSEESLEQFLKSDEMTIIEEAKGDKPHEGFLYELFLGNARFDLLSSFPEQSAEDKEKADDLVEKVKKFLWENVDPDAIDRDEKIPEEVIDGLKKLGIFGLKIPKEYGGLGLSQSNYRRIFQLFGSWCGNISALVAPPNSIGAFLPVWKFGTEEQKNRILPELASGKISAFGLTEEEAGSDPSRIKMVAKRVYDENRQLKGYILNGHKLYTTCAVKDNGIPLADYIPVVARIKDAPIPGQKKQKGGFGLLIVQKDSPGYTTPIRCHFSGLKAIYNGVLLFKDVFVPVENRIGKEGDGFKIAYESLRVGRLTIASICVGTLKQSLQVARWWCKKRVQSRKSIGKHELTGADLVDIACSTLAIDAMVKYCSMLVDTGEDFRLGTGASKILATEYLWVVLDELLQIRGGRGYETFYSLKSRGEPGVGVERMWRDSRVNRIFEGENKIMTLALIDEGLTEYLKNHQIMNRKDSSAREKLMAIRWFVNKITKSLIRFFSFSHYRFIKNEAKKISRDIALLGFWYQAIPSLIDQLEQLVKKTTGKDFKILHYDGGRVQNKQVPLAKISNRVMGLWLMAIVLSYAKSKKELPLILELSDYFCLKTSEKMKGKESTPGWIIWGSHRKVNSLAEKIMAGETKWLEHGIVSIL